jgi:hypothetical protein
MSIGKSAEFPRDNDVEFDSFIIQTADLWYDTFKQLERLDSSRCNGPIERNPNRIFIRNLDISLTISIFLIHYPFHSDKFVPWRIYYQVVDVCNSILNNELKHEPHSKKEKDIYKIKAVLIKFCEYFGVPFVNLFQFFSSAMSQKPANEIINSTFTNDNYDSSNIIPENSSNESMLNILSIITDPFFHSLFAENVLSTLCANSGLLLWEFFRCYTRNRLCSELFSRSIFAFPSLDYFHSNPIDIMPSAKAAVIWANEVASISIEDAKRNLLQTIRPLSHLRATAHPNPSPNVNPLQPSKPFLTGSKIFSPFFSRLQTEVPVNFLIAIIR